MPFPQWLARLNKVGFNRVARHVAPSLPGMGVVVHKGRRSGRAYQTDSPRVYHDETRSGIRPLERRVLGLVGVADFPSADDRQLTETSSAGVALQGPDGARRPSHCVS